MAPHVSTLAIFRRLLLCALLCLSLVIAADARKVKTKVKTPKNTAALAIDEPEWIDSAQEPWLENPGDSISFSGFDKPASSKKESVLVSNHMNRAVTALRIEISYRMTDGRELHNRIVELPLSLPARSTRLADFKSFDTQGSYRYEQNAPTRKSSTPFSVTIRLLALRF